MTGRRHSVISASLTFAGSALLTKDLITSSILAVTASIGAYIPDVDTGRSKAGRKVSKILKVTTIISVILTLVAVLSHLGYISNILLAPTIKLALISWTACLVMSAALNATHRGPTHSLIIPLVCLVATYFYIKIPYLNLLSYGLWIGYALHIIEDLLNGKGAMILYPFSKKYFNIADLDYDGKGERLVEYISILIGAISVLIFL